MIYCITNGLFILRKVQKYDISKVNQCNKHVYMTRERNRGGMNGGGCMGYYKLNMESIMFAKLLRQMRMGIRHRRYHSAIMRRRACRWRTDSVVIKIWCHRCWSLKHGMRTDGLWPNIIMIQRRHSNVRKSHAWIRRWVVLDKIK